MWGLLNEGHFLGDFLKTSIVQDRVRECADVENWCRITPRNCFFTLIWFILLNTWDMWQNKVCNCCITQKWHQNILGNCWFGANSKPHHRRPRWTTVVQNVLRPISATEQLRAVFCTSFRTLIIWTKLKQKTVARFHLGQLLSNGTVAHAEQQLRRMFWR